MKWLFPIIYCVVATTAAAQTIDTLTIYSGQLKENRKLVVYTPWMYQSDSSKKFEVIYAFDAQYIDVFAMVHATAAYQSLNICPMIVVGVISEDRSKDFLPKNENPNTAKNYKGHLGNADAFLKFIADEAAPVIDKKYRTLPKKIAVGHSNGATFITYSLLKRPDLFEAYIAVDPNFGYDDCLFDRLLQQFNSNSLKNEKYYYTCTSNYNDSLWIKGQQLVFNGFNTKKLQEKIHFVCDDFSKTDNHLTVFQPGVLYGVRSYFNYQYFTPERLTAYYSELDRKHLVRLTPSRLLQLGSDLYFSDKRECGLNVLLWASKNYPDDLDLCYGVAEVYQLMEQKENASKYFRRFQEKLQEQRNKIKKEEYHKRKQDSDNRLKALQ